MNKKAQKKEVAKVIDIRLNDTKENTLGRDAIAKKSQSRLLDSATLCRW